MKRILFLLTLSIILLTPNVFANDQNQGYCMNYVNEECSEYRYCNSWSATGCSSHEICRLEKDKYACFNEKGSEKNITYRTKEYVNQLRSSYKPHYTSDIVEKVRNMKMSDSMAPNAERSKYHHPKEETAPENYFKAIDSGKYVYYVGPQRRDVVVNFKQPYSAANRSKIQLYRQHIAYPSN